MKNILIIGFLGVGLLIATSCEKGYLEGINDDPNFPTDVSPKVLLPGAQATLAYTLGGDFQRYAGIMTQYFTGISRQFDGYQSYKFTEEDFNNSWNSMYAQNMGNLNVILKKEAENPGKYSVYAGIARILMAYSLGLTTDLWGDVPFSEAFQGSANLTPAYEPQQAIYDHIQQLLDDALADLTNDTGDDIEYPGGNDFIYEGNVSQWIALAYALKAKHYLHIVNKDANAVNNAAAALADGGPIVNAGFPFSSSAPSPWYQYIEQRDDIAYEGSCLSLMQDRSDPRYSVYVDNTGYLGGFFSAENASVWLMTEFERLFIEAEVKLRQGHPTAEVQAALRNAVNASFSFYGIDPMSTAATAYVAAYCNLNGNFAHDLEVIMTEKWIANYLSVESWTDMRRTSYPVLIPNAGATAIPTRFIYPTNERLYNTQPGVNDNSTMYTPQLWWMP